MPSTSGIMQVEHDQRGIDRELRQETGWR